MSLLWAPLAHFQHNRDEVPHPPYMENSTYENPRINPELGCLIREYWIKFLPGQMFSWKMWFYVERKYAYMATSGARPRPHYFLFKHMVGSATQPFQYDGSMQFVYRFWGGQEDLGL